MIYELTPKEHTEFFEKLIRERKKTFGVYFDYYRGAGNQWDLLGENRGIRTKSGRYVYDETGQLWGYMDRPEESEADYLSRSSVLRKHFEWAEVNIIKTAIDEKARTVRGYGNMSFSFDNVNEAGTELFNTFCKNNRLQNYIPEITKDASIFYHSAITINGDKIKKIDPHMIYEEGESAYVFYKATKRGIQEFLLAIGTPFFVPEEKAEYIFVKETTSQITNWYIDGVIIYTEIHNLGVNPTIIFKNNSTDSDVAEDIPEQDMLNIELTRVLETFKHHLSPAVTINSDSTLEQVKNASANGIKTKLKTGAGVVTFLESNGKMTYHQWNGLPAGISEELDRIERLWSVRRGISFKNDNSNLPESAAAKREARRVLYNIANDTRQLFEVGLDNLAQLFFAQRGVKSDIITNINWAPMIEMSQEEQQKIYLTDFSVHGDQEIYLKQMNYSDEDIERIVSKSNILV